MSANGGEGEKDFSGNLIDLMAILSRWMRLYTKTKWGATPYYSRFLTAAVPVLQML